MSSQGRSRESERVLLGDLRIDMENLNELLSADENFDIVYRKIRVGGREACFYFINGFCKDDVIQKLLQFFLGIKEEDMPNNAKEMSEKYVPYVEVDITGEYARILHNLLSGVFVMLVDGYTEALLLDSRTYPARAVGEPDKDKVLRGSKDGFVETVVFNTALIRRRIRSTDLRIEMMNAGETSNTDIAICYMHSRVDLQFLEQIKKRIREIKVDALTMNQESLAECLYKRRWYNPFPKFKYSERPDTAAAQILEGNIVILVDNSPSAMITPTTIFDVIEEADDYYFPPITGTYLRLTRFLIALLTYLMTPTFLLMMKYPQHIPKAFDFIIIKDAIHIPIIWQFLILELAIDGLRLAAVNTPNMLSTPLSVMAGIVPGEFAVKSGWFNAEIMLYMAFVAIANYTQANYELGYALKFMRILTLLLTAWFGLYGYIGGIVIDLLAVISNKTVARQSYAYPLWPFNGRELIRRLIRQRLPGARK